MDTVAIIAVALIIGAWIALTAWLVHGWIDEKSTTNALNLQVAGLTNSVAERDAALDAVKQDAQRQSVALGTVEKQRDDLLAALAGSGDPHAVAAGIRTSLQQLSGSTPPANSDGALAVHAAAPVAAKP